MKFLKNLLLQLKVRFQKGRTAPLDVSRIPVRYQKDPTLVIRNGQAFVEAKNEVGDTIYYFNRTTARVEPVMKNVTVQARPRGVVQPAPAPSPVQFNDVMHQFHEDATQHFAERMNRQGALEAAWALLLASLTLKKSRKNRTRTKSPKEKRQ